MELMTVTQYAKAANITRQAVTKALREERGLSGIDSFQLIGNRYLLTVDKSKIKKRR